MENVLILRAGGWDSVDGVAARCGLRIPVGARFSLPFQIGPNTHLAPYSMRTESLSRVLSGRSVGLTTHPYLAVRLKKE